MISGISQTTAQLIGVNNRLDTINNNIVSLLKYSSERDSASIDQQQQFFSETSSMMRDIGSFVSEMRDFMENSKQLVPKKRDKTNPLDMSMKDRIKYNFDNSMYGMMYGMMYSMLTMVSSMSSMVGGSPLDMVIPGMMKMLIPKNTKKSIERFDNVFKDFRKNMLYKLGDWSTSDNLLKQFIGEMLGVEREKNFIGSRNMANVKKDQMGWNGIA